MSAEMSNQLSATWSKSPSPWCAKKCANRSKRAPNWRPRTASSTPWSGPAPAPKQKFRVRLRQGELDDKEIEIEVPERAAGPADL